MADTDGELITFGGAGRPSRRETDELIESLFREHYRRLTWIGGARAGDPGQAEQRVSAAYLRLWRRRGILRDDEAALRFLENSVTERVKGGIGRAGRGEPAAVEAEPVHGGIGRAGRGGPVAVEAEPTKSGIGRASGGEPAAGAARAAGIDVGQAWLDLLERHRRAARNRRAWLATATVPALVAAVAISAFAGSRGQPVHRGSAGRPVAEPRLIPQRGNMIPLPGIDPAAIVAHLPLSGVLSLTADGTDLWAVRAAGRRGGAPSYQLVKIDARTGHITLRVGLGPQQPAVAAGGGAVWVTTGSGRTTGQIARLDPATGRLVSTLHLPAADCGSVVYGAGHLFVNCRTSDPATTVFLRVNPATGRVDGAAGPVLGALAVAVVPGGVWYNSPVGVVGLVGFGGRARQVLVADPGSPVNFARTQSLGYAGSYLWVLTSDGTVAQINPATGKVRRTLAYGSFGPANPGSPQSMAVGQGSLWLLGGGGPFAGVLRVSMATGRPTGLAGIPSGSCGQPCAQIYDLAGAVWVPTSHQLIEIAPALMPAEPVFSISAQRIEARPVRRRGLWFCAGPCR